MSNFRRAYLASANLHACLLWGADFREANLEGAKLTRTVLLGANLQQASLRGVDFTQSTLGLYSQEELPEQTARWYTTIEAMPTTLGADLRGADLHGADLRYAYLGEVGSTVGVQLEGARWPLSCV